MNEVTAPPAMGWVSVVLEAQPDGVIRLYEQGQPHHLTLAFNVPRSEWETHLGKRVQIAALSCWANDRVQAIACIPPAGVYCKPYAHITVSWIQGATPVEAVELIRDRHQARQLPFSPQILWGTIQFTEFE